MGIRSDTDGTIFPSICNVIILITFRILKQTYNIYIYMKQLFITLLALAVCSYAQARRTYNFNSDWRIDKAKKTVTLPHA